MLNCEETGGLDMKKLRWTAAAVAAWISLDLYLGQKAHHKKKEDFQPPDFTSGKPRFFRRGDELFAHMLKRIRRAENHIYMNFYIFRNDEVGSDIMDALMERARAGVTVNLLIDWLGARIAPAKRRELKEAGVKLEYSQKPKLPFLFYSLNERNHRKVTVIDGEHAYVGGFNVGDEYTGNDPMIGSWRDYHLYIRGVAVASLGRQFARDWHSACGEKLEIELPEHQPDNEIPIQFISSDGEHVAAHFTNLFKRAEKSVLIGTPYYIPGPAMQKEVLKLARRGIKVRILIPKNPDHPLVKDAALHYFAELLEAGVDVRQFKYGFYHSKIILVDNTILDIGTANFDMRSFNLNHEVNCTIEDDEWISSVVGKVETDFFKHSEKITLNYLRSRTRWEKTREHTAMMFSSWL